MVGQRLLEQRPLMVWAAAFAAGIGLASLGRLPPPAALGVAALGALALLTPRRFSPSLFPAGLLLLGLSAGALRLAAFQAVAPDDVSRLADAPAPAPGTLTGTVASGPTLRPGGAVTFFLDAERWGRRGRAAAVSGGVSVVLGPEAARRPLPDYGDRVALEGTLDTPLPATNPGAFSWRGYLARRAVFCEMRVRRPGGARLLGPGRANPFLALAWRVHRGVLAAVGRRLPPDEAAALSGILIGQRAGLPPALMADFVRTGTVHVLASAGLHVGILAFWLECGLRRLTLPRKAQAVLLILALAMYALVCGGRPAVVRAALMAALYFGAVLFEREPDGPTAVGAAALLILLGQPTALLEPGFQMSFLTILTLAVALPVWADWWRPRVSAIKPALIRKAALRGVEGVGVSLLAQLGAMPVVALSYHEFSVCGWMANLLVVPLLFVVIPLSLLGLALGVAWPGGGAALLAAAGWGTAILLRVVRGFGESPWASVAVAPPPLLVLAFYALVYGGTHVLRRHLQPLAPPPAAPQPAAAPPAAPALVGPGPPP